MADIAIIHNETKSASGGTQPGNQAAWLKQFESAQWQQRLRYQPLNGQQQSPRQSSAAQDSGASTKPLARVAPTDYHHEGRGDIQTSVKENSVGTRPVHADTSSGHAHETVSRPIMAPATATQEHVLALAVDRRYRPVQQSTRFANGLWQSQHVHAMLDAEGVKVWLRDARYQGSDGQRLLQTLRGHFARLGLRLAQFTLNGWTILKSDSSE